MDIEDYLKKKGIGYENLTIDERRAISHFAIIWSLFEARLLSESATASKIAHHTQIWINEFGIEEALVEDHLAYFKQRYIQGNEFNDRFNHLHFRKNDQEQLVRDVLLNKTNDLGHKLACCLIIILRFRNNYFHGIKWTYSFKDQKENFERACRLLIWCIDHYAQQ